jgi:GTP-binding protein
MKITSAEFEVSAPNLGLCPKWPLPEFALIGRSNVGKSSLLNVLTQRHDLAKVSDLPGKTKLINFFVINRSWSLVDLPGYGYAKVGKQRSLEFGEAVADFLSSRRNLKHIFVLIDSRLEPQQIDLEFLRWLDGEDVPFSLVFTKTDKQSASKGLATIGQFQRAILEWRAEMPEIFLSSAKTGAGRTELLNYIQDVIKNAGRQAV